MESTERVKRMQAELVQAEQHVKQFEEALKEFKEGQVIIKKVANYYGSNDWYADREAHEGKRMEVNYNTSILGEDEPYDLLITNQQLAIQMLEIATDMIKNF
ncbi:hypothetical protein BW727_100951 [Jeotgalibaca dankookensis]|uniref:DUF4298 domain-containing protein n=1 Tax=Jeotgalibaca dankookensis TaxID=708126 RepID=A0A1S6IP62_9LACT|nr:DUF4298 domain-containing protein [Jeotgalibaca dankookensis]AQS53343.1 hypothetical protein BW727_100951 [Jeotgalibaca dankookensis]